MRRSHFVWCFGHLARGLGCRAIRRWCRGSGSCWGSWGRARSSGGARRRSEGAGGTRRKLDHLRRRPGEHALFTTRPNHAGQLLQAPARMEVEHQ